jgi:hypothetical protein
MRQGDFLMEKKREMTAKPAKEPKVDVSLTTEDKLSIPKWKSTIERIVELPDKMIYEEIRKRRAQFFIFVSILFLFVHLLYKV